MFSTFLCLGLIVISQLPSSLAIMESSTNISRLCRLRKSCGPCIAESVECHWCSDDASTTSVTGRCDTLANLTTNGCSNTISPNGSIIIEKNEILGNAQGSKEAVQLAPQQVTIRMRTKQPYTIPVTFRLAENYPVDIYFLMDMSHTMKAYKDTLASVSEVLAREIRNVTNNLRFGFGSFVDKPTLPYTDVSKNRTTVSPDPTYCFRNRLSLTEDVSDFKTKVNESLFSTNIDVPEGGLDALMQVLSCKNEIGWRTNSRKLVILFTDESFHTAGDGKLGGVLLPNDEHCHLDSNGFYSESLNRDYPSISQLATVVALNKVSVIFAVTRSRTELYQRLSARIEGSAVGELVDDGTSLVKIVKDNYYSISSSVELKTEVKPADKDINVSYHTICPNGLSSKVPKCSKIELAQSVVFNLTVEIATCPSNKSRSLEITLVGLSDKLIVKLEVICDCDCEKPDRKDKDSSQCTGNGIRECGICKCNSGRFGDTCECGSQNLCIKPQSTTACEDHGSCECAVCNCSVIANLGGVKRYRGEFCQCNDYNCGYFDNKLCGGPTRGVCDCGQCTCVPGHTGPNCACPVDTAACKDKAGDICNKKGQCVCGECLCDENYSGAICEDCPTCQGMCEKHRNCTQCFLRDGVSAKDPCRTSCTNVDVVKKIPDCGNDCLKCEYVDESDLCEVKFVYRFSDSRLIVDEDKRCNKPLATSVIISIAVGLIIFIGFTLLIIWKIVITIHDRREVARFEKEMANMKFSMNQNPIYKEAKTTFQNPTYSDKKQS